MIEYFLRRRIPVFSCKCNNAALLNFYHIKHVFKVNGYFKFFKLEKNFKFDMIQNRTKKCPSHNWFLIVERKKNMHFRVGEKKNNDPNNFDREIRVIFRAPLSPDKRL